MEQLLRRFLLFLSTSKTAQWLVVRFPITRKMSRRFIAGETLGEALAVVRDLRAQGFATSLDLLGENVDGSGEARVATEEVVRALESLQKEGLACNVSVKLTQLGLLDSEETAYDNLVRILSVIDRAGIVLRIDMEGSEYTEQTLDLVRALRQEYEPMATVLQSYLHRTKEDAGVLSREDIAIRLCKGAYAEPNSIAYQSKGEVDLSYLETAELLLREGYYPAFATHDEAMIEGVLKLVRELGKSAEDFEFQMLYGIRQERQRELLEQGWTVRLYVPYGQSWYPYFMRRLAERPANVAFFLTALLKG